MRNSIFLGLLWIVAGCYGENISSLRSQVDSENASSEGFNIYKGTLSPNLYTNTGRFDGGGFRCSGTLVCGNVVMTAAHCNKAAGVGATFSSEVGGLVRQANVKSFIPHPKYAVVTGLPYDLALAVLDKKLCSDSACAPNFAASDMAVNEAGTVVGYGGIDAAGTIDNDRRWGAVKFSSFSAATGPASGITKANLVQIGCGGDSGGPIILTSSGPLSE